MKKVITALSFVLFITLTSETYAQLPIGLAMGVRGGVLTKDNNAFAGAQVELKVPFLTFVPNYEHIFIKDLPTHTMNLDLQYTVFSAVVAKMFVGGGYVIQAAKPKGLDNFMHSGFNAQVGAKAGFGPAGVFALAKYVKVKKSDTFGLAVGVNYNLF
jgi:hypothetical protein